MLELSNRLRLQTDVLIIMFLAIFSLSVMLYFLYIHGETMIYLDSYLNYQKIVAFSEGSEFEKITVTSGPFFVFYSSLYTLFQDSPSVLQYLRIVNMLIGVVLTVSIYKISRKLFDPFISLACGVLATFLPVVMIYSVTLHSDIFAYAMGFLALYFSIKPKNYKRIILATFFIVMTASRLDVLLFFTIPYLIGISYFLAPRIKVKFPILFLIILCVCFIPSYFAIEAAGIFYKDAFFDYSLMNQITTLVNANTVSSIIESSLEITGDKAVHISGDDGINIFYKIIFLFGIGFFTFITCKKFLEFVKKREIEINQSHTVSIFLATSAIISILGLAAFHTPITLVDRTIIDDEILPRYMIGLRLFAIFPFIFGLWILSQAFTKTVTSSDRWIYYQIKHFKATKSRVFSEKFVPEKELRFYLTAKTMSYAFVAIVVIILSFQMWDSAVRFYENDSTQINVYKKAAVWLTENMREEEMVFLPMKDVFWSFEPSLKSKTYEYIQIWDQLDYKLRLVTTQEQISEVKNTLKDFAHDPKNNVKFMVFSWNDHHGKISSGITHIELPKPDVCSEFDKGVSEAVRFDFRLPHSNWKNNLVICEIM